MADLASMEGRRLAREASRCSNPRATRCTSRSPLNDSQMRNYSIMKAEVQRTVRVTKST